LNKSLLDIDIFSEITKGVNPTVTVHATAYRQAFSRYAISAVTFSGATPMRAWKDFAPHGNRSATAIRPSGCPSITSSTEADSSRIVGLG
jgi:hypothetical protein